MNRPSEQDSAQASPSSGADDPSAPQARDREARLLRAASHDIRGPIANVRAYAAFLKDPRMELSPKAAKAVDTIVRNADRALGLLREFIDSEQAARGRLELPTEPVEVRKLAEAAARAQAAYLEEQRVSLELAPGDAAALAEATALEHILRALIENAAHRSPEGGTVLVRIGTADDRAVVSVTDSGAPIAEDERDELFDRDVQLERHPKLAIGFRLSLAATEARVMGGEIEVRSEEGQTTFSLRLPSAAA